MSLVVDVAGYRWLYRLMPDLRFVQFPGAGCWSWRAAYAVFVVAAAVAISREALALCRILRGL